MNAYEDVNEEKPETNAAMLSEQIESEKGIEKYIDCQNCTEKED